MPNINFEYTNNLDLDNIEPIILSIHKILETELPTNIDNCKTSVTKHEVYYVGDINKKAAFMRFKIYVMPGRSESLLKRTSQKIVNLLKDTYIKLFEKFDIQISVAIIDLPNSYCKVANTDL